jgi:hypothetical protein
VRPGTGLGATTAFTGASTGFAPGLAAASLPSEFSSTGRSAFTMIGLAGGLPTKDAATGFGSGLSITVARANCCGSTFTCDCAALRPEAKSF